MGAERAGARVLSTLLYAEVNLARIDGSSVWLASTADLLARAGCAVTLALDGRLAPDTPLLRPLVGRPEIRIVERPARRHRWPGDRRARIESAVDMLRELDAREGFDMVLIRGLRIATRLASEPAFVGRLWTYLTDVPQFVGDLDEAVLAHLDAIARASRIVLCQTEELRSYLESIVPAMVGRTALLPPVVPEPTDLPARDDDTERPIRLAYAGKFAPLWKTLEMTRLPSRLAELGIDAELVAVGDKVHSVPGDPTYRDRMQAALEQTPGVLWRGGRSRDDAMRLTAAADIGLGWRDESLDVSLELSTKVLEYGIMNLAVVLNRTPMHERLLGVDYPLFASSEDDVIDAVAKAVADPSIRHLAAERAHAAAAGYTFERGTDRLVALLAGVFPPPLGSAIVPRPLRIGVASHDLKFFSAILRHLQSLPDVEVRVDHWPALARNDPEVSKAIVDWADVIICEWCGPNAVWYSKHTREGQRLIVRLHRFELDRGWHAEVDIDKVERVVCVSESYASLTRTVTRWPASKVVVIPNWVDDAALDRAKSDGAQFHLGFIGMVPSRKRLDRALDVLECLRADDPRFRLFVKTKLTWDYPWFWRRPEEKAHVDLVMRRIQVSSLLRGSVVFDGFGPDVASWLRRIGFILSTSDDESFHLAPAEGMASGAVPAILDWPGADTIYDTHWIHRSTDAMAHWIASVVEQGRWDAERDVAKAQAQAAFGLARVSEAWGRLVGDIEGDVGVGSGPHA
jgi:glycosyltransferase involved in cell wall biosynthesis